MYFIRELIFRNAGWKKKRKTKENKKRIFMLTAMTRFPGLIMCNAKSDNNMINIIK